MSPYRLILYHKHPSSGRTLFLRLGETVCQFAGLSAEARVVESHIGGDQVKQELTGHLADWIAEAEQRLNLESGSLTLDREFDVAVEDADQLLQIYLVRFTAIDPPLEQLAAQSGKFLALTDARRLPPPELELLRLAYTAIMDELA
ncbi:MAG: hypothetical protein ACKO7W_09155 [Elainella sp.]